MDCDPRTAEQKAAANDAAAKQRAENAAYEAEAMKKGEAMRGVFMAPVVHCMTDQSKLCAYPPPPDAAAQDAAQRRTAHLE
jgi:hypothetical protein